MFTSLFVLLCYIGQYGYILDYPPSLPACHHESRQLTYRVHAYACECYPL